MFSLLLKALILATPALAQVKNQITGNYVSAYSNNLFLKGATSGRNKVELTMADNGGARIYMLDPSKSKYQLFDLNNVKFSFQVDLSKIPCGYNLALYFVEMKENSPRGFGYCDAQGSGAEGCNELDIFEANRVAMQFTSHSCMGGNCDKWGLGVNRKVRDLGLNPDQPFRVVSSFKDGVLVQKFIQNRRVVPGAMRVFDNQSRGGGLAEMSRANSRGMVMVMSLWSGGSANGMSWLDGGCTSFPPPSTAIKGVFSRIAITPLN